MTTSQRRSLIGLNPVYAMLGATDLAAQKLREIGARATGESAPTDATGTTRADLRRLVVGARQVPAIALNEAVDVVVRTQSQFNDLAERGERVLKRQPRVQQTEELLDRAGKTVARGQAAASRAAHTAADRTRDRATSAVHSAREQADDVVEAVSHFGRTSSPSTLLRRGSVARPVRAAQGDTADATPARPKPRRPRVSPATGRATGAPASDDEGRGRHGIPSSSGVEAGATVTTAKKSGSKAAARPAAGTSAVATRRAATAGKAATSAKSAAKSPATGPASKPASAKGAAKKAAPRRRAAASTSATAPASTDSAPATPAPSQEA